MQRSNPTLRSTLALLVIGMAGVMACATEGDATDDEQNFISGGAPPTDIFGDDRVGAVLRGKSEKVPGSFSEFEQLFKVGRACDKAAKEIFVVQEAQTRRSGSNAGTKVRLPRAVIGGCATTSDPNDPLRPSYSLMAALISGDTGTDNMDLTHVESIALDNTTGEYNFYAFDTTGSGKPGSVTRTFRDATGNVTAKVWIPGEGTKTIPTPLNCFGCHVNGGPLMNELFDSWSNWVSFRAPLPKDLKMSGDTLAIVRKAQTASDLQQIIESATNFTVQGSSPETGFGARTLSGKAPGSLATLMKSVFCETELNYKSGHPSLGAPLELFVDPSSAQNTFVPPPLDASDVFPFLLPVRSVHDNEVEIFLQIQGLLTPSTVLSIRLLDDENDIFSSARCNAWKDATAQLPKAPADVDKKIRDVLAKKVAEGAFKMSAEQKAYVAQLLKVEDGDASLEPLKAAYLTELRTRFQAAAAQMATADGRKTLKAREAARKAAATKMFRGGGPLPALEKK